MTDRGRLGLVAAGVILVHGAVVLVMPPPLASPPVPTPQTTWIGFSFPVPEAPRPQGNLPRAPASTVAPPGTTDSPTPQSLPGEAFVGEATKVPASPGEPLLAPQEERPLPEPPPVQTPPRVPAREVLARLVYPPLALRRRLEATVVLDLLVNEVGVVSPTVVEDPGHGFAEAAVRAFEGLVVTPAQVAGNPVASRVRYPVRFVLP